MSNDILKQTEIEIADRTAGLLCAVKFFENKKRNFKSVVALASKADLSLRDKEQFLIGFSKTKAQARLAMAMLEEMRVANWDFILFANGRVQIKKPAFRNMLDCFGVASELRDPSKHCLDVFDSAIAFVKNQKPEFRMSLFDMPPMAEMTFTMPCKMLNGFISVSVDQLPELKDHVEAAAIARSVSSCPYFNLDGFKVEPKKKEVSTAKRYW